MTKDLLWRGMLAGVLAALLATLFARVYAEPLIDRAIAFEESHESHAHGAAHGYDAEDAPVSRATQRGAGLATAVLVYGAAVGGVFALVFAYCYGRLGRIGPRTLAVVIAVLGFLVVVIVPGLKYPPNPPAVGNGATIQLRTAAYFGMIAISIVALVLAGRVRLALKRRIGAFNALFAAAAVYVVAVLLAQIGLPVIDEVPADFSASLLWNYRVAAIGVQVILWAMLGLGFGWLAERRLKVGAR
uniref:CbtA family protein n=1 Tax=uncultured Sphingomonas sp. TaxID=158754 RepID=UPI0035CB0073